MKNYAMFNYEFLFCDHFSKLSNNAKLLYIEMNFFANNGFVANPLAICDSRDYGKDTLIELIGNGDVLVLPNRCEVFLTSFFIHNKGAKSTSWLMTPFAPYWKEKLFIKSNGVATFKPQPLIEEPKNDSGEQLPYNDPEILSLLKTKWENLQ